MRRYGVPEEVLTDNGKQFTGRSNKPRPAEVLFERILRENGIAQRLTKPASPTTTGKIERFHKPLRDGLLNDAGPFADLAAAQAAIDRFVAAYNTERPHQSLHGATAAQRFTSTWAAHNGAGDEVPLRMPPELAAPHGGEPVAFEVVVPPSGNLWICGRQLWLGPQPAGHTVTIWADLTSLHLSIDGVLLKTLPSRFTAADLAKLRRRQGAHPGGPPPRAPAAQAATLTDADVVEVDRQVNAAGVVVLGKRPLCIGQQLAGRLVHVLADGFLVRTLPSPIPAAHRARLQGARLAPGELPTPAGPQVVQRKVSRGTIQVAGEQLRVGLDHSGKIVTVIVEANRFQVLHDGVPLKTFPAPSTSTSAGTRPTKPTVPDGQRVKDQPNTIRQASGESRHIATFGNKALSGWKLRHRVDHDNGSDLAAGFWLLEVDSHAGATEWARRVPRADVEVREVAGSR